MIALLHCLPAVYAAGIPILTCARSHAMPAFCSVYADFIINLAVFYHVAVALAFVVAASRDIVSNLARIPGNVDLPH